MARLFRDSLEFDKTDVLEFTTDAELKPERSTIVHHVSEFLKRDIKPDDCFCLTSLATGWSTRRAARRGLPAACRCNAQRTQRDRHIRHAAD